MHVLHAHLHPIALLVLWGPTRMEELELAMTPAKLARMDVNCVIPQAIAGGVFQVFIFPQGGQLVPDAILLVLNAFPPQNAWNAKKGII